VASTHALAQATMKVFETRAPRRGIGEAEREREKKQKRGAEAVLTAACSSRDLASENVAVIGDSMIRGLEKIFRHQRYISANWTFQVDAGGCMTSTTSNSNSTSNTSSNNSSSNSNRYVRAAAAATATSTSAYP
jgi:hypothetical protein